ncbi:HAD-IIA family hydrolase [Lentisphaerota bacterium ZTH]|nr:HAD family hydrolase [Lentisphaerota bacterium]WET07725.1 HAD-IIA family hydrolase [Lentisphaerota bacterium ZTH]
MKKNYEILKKKTAFISDMDGVIYHGNRLLPGAAEFIEWLNRNNKNFLFLTNSSERTRRELHEKLLRLGVDVPKEHFYTSALATAEFLAKQRPGCSAYVIGEAGLTNALYERGISMNDTNPDYVIVGDTRTYNFEQIEKAVFMIQKGSRLIGTNPDMTGPTEKGIVPATGSLIAPIELATGVKAYFVGKPNSLMMRRAVKTLGSPSRDTVIIGDRMDTDIIAGIEAEVDTVLLLSGVTQREELDSYAYRPRYVFKGLDEMMQLIAN